MRGCGFEVKEEKERIGVADMTRITGLTKRGVQDMAARGDIPSAAKIGRNWTFDEKKVRRWIRQKEREVENDSDREIDAEFFVRSTDADRRMYIEVCKREIAPKRKR